MNILAIDTSTDYLSLAVMKNSRILGRFHKKSSMRHSSLLMPMLDKLLKQCRIAIDDIDCFAVSIGPGSFTGLRIGVATVKGLAYILKKPVAAVPTLDVIAAGAKSFRGIICPVLDARKGKLYASLYKSDGKNVKAISGYTLVAARHLLDMTSEYDKIIFLGDGVRLLGMKEKIHRWHPRADVVAKMGAASFKIRKFVDAEDLEPLYLYSKECDITGQ